MWGTTDSQHVETPASSSFVIDLCLSFGILPILPLVLLLLLLPNTPSKSEV